MIILPVERRLDWKHAPIALISIIVMNILVFFLYQTGDDERYFRAVQSYMQHGFLAKEWPIYQQYLQEQQQIDKLDKVNALYLDKDTEEVTDTLLRDRGFYDYLYQNGPDLFYWDYYSRWSTARERIQQQIDSVSYIRFGVVPNDLSIADLIIHQFLHGDFLHLTGNMVFLMICGFVVEAAIGHLPFLAFYLIGGMVAGLSHSLMDLDSSRPLVGASGAISAVMAMYLVLYRWKKIQFFYWFYVVVGYFRAPAIVILPIYIGKELYSYYFDGGSNVAFMAHAGGFVAGALLIALTAAFKPSVLDTDYLESSDDDIDPYRKALADIYDALEKYRFDSAGRLLQEAINEYGERFELLLLRHNLLKIHRGEAWQKSLNRILLVKDLTDEEVKAQEKLWLDAVSADQPLPEVVGNKALLNAALNFTRLESTGSAEKLFELLQKRNESKANLSKLANYISRGCARLNQPEKHRTYLNLAQKMVSEG